MWTDVIELRDFYDTAMGRTAQRMIRERVRDVWPDVRGARVLGFGYATPYLQPFRTEAERVIAVMPAQQGVLHWPAQRRSLVAMSAESDLPIPDLSIDRVLLVHAVECSEQLRPMLREIWRVLTGGGRILVVAPNRRGLWARFERSPFGHGQPYSVGQLSRLLRDNLFTPRRSERALFVPPARSRMVLTAAPAFEKVGSKCFPVFAGVTIVEAEKQIYAANPIEVGAVRKRVPAQSTGNTARVTSSCRCR